MVDENLEGTRADSRMVSFQIPAQWMPWIEEERMKRGLRTRSDFLRKAVLENIEIREKSPSTSPNTIIVRGPIPPHTAPSGRRIKLEIHDSLRRGVEYFSKIWGLEPERLPETLQLATRTYAYLSQELEYPKEDGKGEVAGANAPERVRKGISDEEKMTVLSSSGTAVKTRMGEIGTLDDPAYGQIPEVILEFELTPEIDRAIFTAN